MCDKPLENVIDLSSERQQRVHDLNEKRLQKVRAAFVNVLPLAQSNIKSRKKAKKKS